MRSIDSGVEDGHRDSAATYRQSAIRPRQINIATNAINAGDAARARVEVPLKCAIAINRSHRRQMRDCRQTSLCRRHSYHGQRTIARTAEYAYALQIRDV